MFILIRHAQSALDLTQPARLWPLTSAGLRQSASLGRQLKPFGLTRLISSEEMKAQQTAEGIAKELDVGWQTAVNLHEHDRSNITNMPGAEFKANVRSLLTNPKGHQFGRETGEAARLRFETAVSKAITTFPQDKLGIVAHGTVITLLLAAHNQIDPVSFWETLPMPAAIFIDENSFQIVKQLS